MSTASLASTKVKERPILFSASMVRALLAGTKTQTRRIIKPQGPLQPECWDNCKVEWSEDGHSGPGWYAWDDGYEDDGAYFLKSRYGQPGDRLWVRETWNVARCSTDYETGGETDYFEWESEIFGNARDALNRSSRTDYRATLHYAADGESVNPCVFYPNTDLKGNVVTKAEIPWRPSIHMPRWASRLTLEITDVRVERLQDIRSIDAKEEGIDYHVGCYARGLYATLWESINGPGSWDLNPWVWVISFKRVTA